MGHKIYLDYMKKYFIFLTLVLLSFNRILNAQIISYPVAAQPITRGYDTSLLTIKLTFPTSCNATRVLINFPTSVRYIAGSVTKVSGGGAAIITVSENNITNTRSPLFNINSITSAGEVTFTVKRLADCGNGSAGKDTVVVTSSCGNITENSSTLNNYNINAPSFSFTPPTAINNALIGGTYTRNYSVVNGGNGCIDTLRFYIIKPTGIQFTTSLNAISVGAQNFAPWRTNGDTLFYKIFGATIFGGKKSFCNGDNVQITENIRIANCSGSLVTNYGAYWSRFTWPGCQDVTGSATVTMANGAPSLSANTNTIQAVGYCRPGIYEIVYSNTGTGNANSGAVYNIINFIGHNRIGQVASLPVNHFAQSGYPFTIDSIYYGTLKLTVTQTGTNPWQVNTVQFTTDPDGVGVGLEDLDGDGSFDDLAPGQSFTLTVFEKWNCNENCRGDFAPSSTLRTYMQYRTMCGSANTNTAQLILGNGPESYANTSPGTLVSTFPASIENAVPFTARVCLRNSSNTFNIYKPTDSLYLDIQLPPGINIVGANANAKINDVLLQASAVELLAGNILRIKRLLNDLGSYTLCYEFDMVYSCGTGGALNFGVSTIYVGDNSCNCKERWFCENVSVNAICPTCVSSFINNKSKPTVVRNSLGYTNNTATVKRTPSAVVGFARYTALPLDTITIHAGAVIQRNETSIFYRYELATPIANENALSFVAGNVFVRVNGVTSSCALPTPNTALSTSALQVFVFNATSCIPMTGLQTGDSIWVETRYAVTNANNDLLFGSYPTQVPNTKSYFYSLNGTVEEYCNSWGTDVLLIGKRTVTGGLPISLSFTGCNSSLTAQISASNLTDIAEDAFPNEFRPSMVWDSIQVNLPLGYELDITRPITYRNQSWTSKIVYATNISNPITQSFTNLQSFTIINPKTAAIKYSDLGPANAFEGLQIYIRTNCTATNASVGYTFNAFYKDYTWIDINGGIPKNTGDVNGATLASSGANPNITISNNTGTVQGINTQHFWDVQLNNTSAVIAPYTWLAIEKGTSGISIDSVVLKPTNTSLLVNAYNTTSEWYRVSTTGIVGGGVQQARIYFKYNKCTLDSVLVRTGWNCSSYPTPDPRSYPCTSAQTYLKVDPLVGETQLSILRQPGNNASINLCTTDSILLNYNSAQAANVISPYITFYPPTGVTVINPIEIEYPFGSNQYEPVSLIPIAGGGYLVDITEHTGIGVNGMPGTLNNPALAGRQAKIKIPYTTDCSITSGASFNLFAYGNRTCGQPAIGNNSNTKTNGINISGGATNGIMSINLTNIPSSLSCTAPVTLQLSVTPLVANTQVGDTIEYELPSGINYNGNFASVANCSNCTVTTAAGNAGATLVKIKLDPNINSGTAINFRFDVVPSVSGGCRTVNINANAKRSTSPFSCGAMPCSNSSSVIGTGSKPNINLVKTDLFVSNFTVPGATATLTAGVAYNFDVTVRNLGGIAYTNPVTVNYFCGTSSVPFSSTFNGPIAVGATVTRTMSVTIPFSPLCENGNDIIATIRPTTTSCVCDSTGFRLLNIVVPVKIERFDATYTSANKAEINWQILQETNQYYTLEYSYNGVQFETLHIVRANGTGKYMFTHAYQPTNTVIYYRLKITEANGATTYSNIIKLAKQLDNAFTVLPNPFVNNVTIQYTSTTTEALTIAVSNTLGQQLITKKYNALVGTNTYTINEVVALPKATYIVTLTSNTGQRISTKIMKQ
jgi:hypothetical protein